MEDPLGSAGLSIPCLIHCSYLCCCRKGPLRQPGELRGSLYIWEKAESWGQKTFQEHP